MKVLHVINSLKVGGAEVILRDSILAINDHQPDIEQHLVTLYEDGALLDSVKNTVSHKNIGLTKWNVFSKILLLRKYILDNKFDIVHAHLYEAMILCRLAAPASTKLIATYHSFMYNPEIMLYSRKRLLVDRLTKRKKQISIFVSQSVRQDILSAIPKHENEFVLYNFPAKIFKPLYQFKNSSSLKIISVGNLKTEKNHFFIIKAMETLKNLDIQLDIYGTGEMENELNSYILRCGAKVKIYPNRKITSEILAQYDLFIMSSLVEGMSIALLEAMTTGLPSLLSNIPSFREIAKDSALYFDLEDHGQVANQIHQLFLNKKTLESLSGKALNFSSNYTMDKYLNGLFKIYGQ